MSKVQDYLSLDLGQLRKLCIDKGLPGVTRKSDRQQCVNAIMDAATTRRSLPKRSRKRSRHDLDQQKDKKRRKLMHHRSTVTTQQSQNPQPAQSLPMNYQSPVFLNLLDENLSDGDIDVSNENNNKNTNVGIKQKKVKNTKSPLITIKDSSSEDNEFDIDNDSDIDDNNNEFDIELSETDTSSSESNESDEGLSIIPPQRQTNHHRHHKQSQQPQHSRLMPQTVTMSPRSPIQPFSISHPPPIPIPVTNIHDDIKNDNSGKPITFKSRIKEYYLYIIDYIPLKIMEIIGFLSKHSFIIMIVIIIIILLYLLTIKMIESRIKYCDSNGDDIICEINKLQKQMEIYSISLLSSRCGQYECQKYWLYNKLYSINKENDNIIFDKALSEEELEEEFETKLAVTFKLDSTSHLFSQAFERFTKSIKEYDKTLPLKPLQYDRSIGYYSNKSSKSMICHLTMFLSDYFVIITTAIFGGLGLSLFWWILQRKTRQRLEKKQLEQDRKENIIYVLRTDSNETNQGWIAIDEIRAQTMEGVSDREWEKVKNLVVSDGNVQKAVKVADGLPILCWKLSDAALTHVQHTQL